MPFTKNSVLVNVLKHKGAEKILAKYKLPCLTCPLLKFEIGKLKLGKICENYGIDTKKVVEELNKKIKDK
jgi:hypothetical protein